LRGIVFIGLATIGCAPHWVFRALRWDIACTTRQDQSRHTRTRELACTLGNRNRRRPVSARAAPLVPDVMLTPERRQPTQGGLAAALAVSVSAVDEPDVLPTPEPSAVKSPML